MNNLKLFPVFQSFGNEGLQTYLEQVKETLHCEFAFEVMLYMFQGIQDQGSLRYYIFRDIFNMRVRMFFTNVYILCS